MNSRYRMILGNMIHFPLGIELRMDAKIDDIWFTFRHDETSDTLRCERVEPLGQIASGKWTRNKRRIIVSIPKFNPLIVDLLGHMFWQTRQEAEQAAKCLSEWSDRLEMTDALFCDDDQLGEAVDLLLERGYSSREVRGYFQEKNIKKSS